MMLCRVRVGIFCLRLSACLPAAAALSRLPPTVYSASLPPECPGVLVPLALQWRMNGADAR